MNQTLIERRKDATEGRKKVGWLATTTPRREVRQLFRGSSELGPEALLIATVKNEKTVSRQWFLEHKIRNLYP